MSFKFFRSTLCLLMALGCFVTTALMVPLVRTCENECILMSRVAIMVIMLGVTWFFGLASLRLSGEPSHPFLLTPALSIVRLKRRR